MTLLLPSVVVLNKDPIRREGERGKKIAVVKTLKGKRKTCANFSLLLLARLWPLGQPQRMALICSSSSSSSTGVEKAAEPSVDEHGITIEDEEGEKGGDGDSGKRLAALLEPEKGKEEDDKKGTPKQRCVSPKKKRFITPFFVTDEEEAEKEEEVALGHGLFGLGLVGRGGLKERRMKTRRNNAVAAAVAVVDTNVVTAEKRKRSIVTVLPATDEQEEETVEQDRNKVNINRCLKWTYCGHDQNKLLYVL